MLDRLLLLSQRVLLALSLAFTSMLAPISSVSAKDPLEAASDLAATNQTDPNGFTLMVVCICMLFVFALTLIIAASVHVFKKKPGPTAAQSNKPEDLSYTSSRAPH